MPASLPVLAAMSRSCASRPAPVAFVFPHRCAVLVCSFAVSISREKRLEVADRRLRIHEGVKRSREGLERNKVSSARHAERPARLRPSRLPRGNNRKAGAKLQDGEVADLARQLGNGTSS